MQIIDLKYRNRRSGSEVTVLFDDDSTIPLDAEVAVRFQLARGMHVTSDIVEQMRLEDEFLRAKRKLVEYLSLRKKSSLDAKLYLRKKGFSQATIEAAVNYAEEQKYLNDANFAESFVRMRTKAATKGPRVVTNELQAHGITPEDAKKAVESMADPESQMEMARKVAARKYPTIKDSEDLVKAARKLSQHLARRGFDPDICDRITREFFGDPTQF